jgi:hypothetical protein
MESRWSAGIMFASPNRLRDGHSHRAASPEKAGVGGSIPSLATI